MIRIGIECESIEGEIWGVGRQISKLLEQLSSRPELAGEFKFFLYFKSRIPDYPYLKSPLFEKRIIWQPFPHKSFSLYYFILLPIRAWRDKLDVFFSPNYMLSPLYRGKSLVMFTEDIWYEMRSRAQKFRYRLAYRIFANWAAYHATRLMAITESSKREIVRLFGISPSRVVTNAHGIDIAPSATRYTLHATRSPYILFVAQAFPRRHLKESIAAFEIIAPQFPGLEFIIIGKDKYNPPIVDNLILETNKHLGRTAITHHEYVSADELVQLMSEARLLIYISFVEAFGLPPLEALACGTPAVVARTPVTQELLGDKAFFVEKQFDPKDIARSMIDGLKNHAKRNAIIAAGPGIVQQYTWKMHADRFLALCRGIIEHES